MYTDLFTQAEQLAKLDARRPRQANLRRAVSSAYYAVFHYLVHESCCTFFGSQSSDAAYRHVLGRAFQHAVMKAACVSFGGGTLKDAVIKGLPRDADGRYEVHVAIRRVATLFVELQEKRQLADYDRSERFERSDVLTLITEAKQKVAQFSELQFSNERTFFLACLWAWKELVNR